MSKPVNRFTSFADPEEVAATAAAQQQQSQKKTTAANATKKVVIKKAPARAADADEEAFASVTDRPQTVGRGGRGGRGRGDGERREGGDRVEGGRGRGGDGESRGRGERRGGRGRGDGESRGRGERRGGDREGGRGRGEGRGRGPPRLDADGNEIARPERRERKFEGKPREEAHPMDKQDGTGRGRRGDRKDGERRGGWGDKKPVAEGETEENKDGAPAEEEKRAPRREREPREPVVVEEQEEVGFTLDDYINQKSAKGTGLLADTKVARDHEKV